jgi:signal transduction histidine kinase
MKIKTTMLVGFFAIAALLASVAGVSAMLNNNASTAMATVLDKNEKARDINEFSEKMYEDYALILGYINSEDSNESGALLTERNEIHEDNYARLDGLVTDFQRDGEYISQIENIEASYEYIDQIFEDYVSNRTQKEYNDQMFMDISDDITNVSQQMNADYFEIQGYTSALTEYHSLSGVNTTAMTLFYKMLYLEAEYLWQYKDQGHLDELVEVAGDLKSIIPLTTLSQGVKDGLINLLDEYENYINDIHQYVDPNDIDTLTAQEVKLRRKSWIIKHDVIRAEWIENPVFNDTFYLFRNYSVGGSNENKSLDMMYYQLGSNEKLFIFKDDALMWQNYDQLALTIEECKAYVNVTNLDSTNRTALITVFDDYMGIIDDLLGTHSIYVSTIGQIQKEKTDLIASVSSKMDDIMMGAGSVDEAGLDYILQGINQENSVAIQKYNEASTQLSTVGISGIIIAIIVAILLGLLISGYISRPIIEMTEGAKKVKEGDYDISVEESGGEELSELAHAFNQMSTNLKKTVGNLETSNKELEHFAYAASHDLQEPLRMVTSYLGLLKRRYKGKLDSDADEFIEYSMDGALRMRNLINDLLAYSRVGTKGKPFKPTDCELVFKNATSNLRLAIKDSSGIVTHDRLPKVMADESQMTQVLQNLMGNAIKFNDKDPRIHVSAVDEGSEWKFSVKDNGIGIDPKFNDRIFKIFQRLHGRDNHEGTGVGLALCKRIVERHGGRIWVDSSPGKGSTFHFTVPNKVGDKT